MNYELIDNFLAEEEFKKIQELFLSIKIAWNCCNGVVLPGDGIGPEIVAEAEFESNGMKVNSVENRLIIFDSNEKHRAVTTTDTSRRVVINFNYFI